MNKKQFLLLLLPLFLTLTSCITAFRIQPSAVTVTNWASFEMPPVGTPLIMRVFNHTGGRHYEVVDFPGKFDDGEPFLVSFPIWKTLNSVIRIELHFQCEVLAVRRFNPFGTLTKGTIAGYKK